MGMHIYDFLPGGWVGARFSRQATLLRSELSRELKDLTVHILEEDRTLLFRYLIDCVPTRTLARELGVAPRSVTRRVHTLLERVRSREYALVARDSVRMGRLDARIAHAHFCEGYHLREVARKLGTSVYRVRLVRARIIALVNRAAPVKAPAKGVAA